jgi:hypothetical protein
MEDDDINRVSGTNETEEKYTLCFDGKTYRDNLEDKDTDMKYGV